MKYDSYKQAWTKYLWCNPDIRVRGFRVRQKDDSKHIVGLELLCDEDGDSFTRYSGYVGNWKNHVVCNEKEHVVGVRSTKTESNDCKSLENNMSNYINV